RGADGRLARRAGPRPAAHVRRLARTGRRAAAHGRRDPASPGREDHHAVCPSRAGRRAGRAGETGRVVCTAPGAPPLADCVLPEVFHGLAWHVLVHTFEAGGAERARKPWQFNALRAEGGRTHCLHTAARVWKSEGKSITYKAVFGSVYRRRCTPRVVSSVGR